MPYHQFNISAPKQLLAPLIQRCMALGSLGVIEGSDSLTAYFPHSLSPKLILRELDIAISLLSSRVSANRRPAVTHEVIPDSNWNATWQARFKPLSIGKCFSIIPPWEKASRGRIALIIDPGMAFGTGHHETTRSCLLLMEKYASVTPRKRFLDLGTGTGLLAIAARKLGFEKVLGIDNDPESIKASRRNRILNGARGVSLRECGIGMTRGVFDMIAANLIAGTLIELSPSIARRTAPSGIVIMSGILKGQDREVLAAARNAGLRLRERLRDGKWVSLVLGW